MARSYSVSLYQSDCYLMMFAKWALLAMIQTARKCRCVVTRLQCLQETRHGALKRSNRKIADEMCVGLQSLGPQLRCLLAGHPTMQETASNAHTIIHQSWDRQHEQKVQISPSKITCRESVHSEKN